MKELQKYSIGDMPHELTEKCTYCFHIHLASEADAAFAALKSENEELLLTQVEIHRQHAEEIERIQSVAKSAMDFLSGEVDRLQLQAERYEKLRILNPQQFLELWKTNLMGPRFDDLVDQLPGRSESHE